MHGNTSRRWLEIAATLKATPGLWAPVLTAPYGAYARAVASRIRHGKLVGFRDGMYEARTRGVVVEVRYVGVPTNRKDWVRK